MTTAQVDRLAEKIDKIADDVSDIRERVTRLETNDEARLRTLNRIQWGIGLAIMGAIGGVPVLFLVWDRLSN